MIDRLSVTSTPSMAVNTESRKLLGAYYTEGTVADFLVRWAVRRAEDRVLDPGLGGGVFLVAAARRLRALGGDPPSQVSGIEVDPSSLREFSSNGARVYGIARLLQANFFEVSPGDLPPVDAVVGNPPFIRYQRFSGALRERALERARQAGVELSRLTSSWAPFLVHAAQFVAPGGRLAMVAPAELAHAAYAKPVLSFLRQNFGSIRIISFSRRIFPWLSEDTVLVLADGRGQTCNELTLIDVPDARALAECIDPAAHLADGKRIDAEALGARDGRLLHYLLPSKTLELYQRLRAANNVVSLGQVADVGIGYVTGDNAFFHLDHATIDAFRIPPQFLRPAVRGGAQLSGLRFTQKDWDELRRSGRARWLLAIPPDAPLPEGVLAYLHQGTLKGAPQRYKCRVRQPWYSVPHVYVGDALLTYMNGAAAKLVANDAGAVSPNTLHVLRLRPDSPLAAVQLAAVWQTSLTALSCEMEGHSLGGGMLKLEPTEAERVAIAVPPLADDGFAELCQELDSLLRAEQKDLARQRADESILRHSLGLDATDIRRLWEGWRLLRDRRTHR